MLVISDTSPLCYAVVIGADHALPELFKEIIIPTSVAAELKHPRAPDLVRMWIGAPPLWLQIREDPTPIRPEFARLDPGEAAALELAARLHASLVLVDERTGSDAARLAG